MRQLRAAQAAVPRAEQHAAQIVAEARAKVDEARRRLAAAIIAADRAGMRQRDIVAGTGYSRERIRQIIRSADIESQDAPRDSEGGGWVRRSSGFGR